MEDFIEKHRVMTKSNEDFTSQTTVNEIPIDNNQVLTFPLRIRNTQGDLHDIKFEFNKLNETAQEIVSEMVSAILIDERDINPVTSSMIQLIENLILVSVTFPLNSFDDKLLIGFAQLSLNI